MLKKRFIAGAVCPKCEQMDKLMMYDTEDHQRFRECVSCGFKELLVEQSEPDELTTRVNQARPGEQALAHEDEVQVVSIMDPKKLH